MRLLVLVSFVLFFTTQIWALEITGARKQTIANKNQSPSKEHTDLDEISYPTDKPMDFITRKLNTKPNYVGWTKGMLKLKAFPANSSARTKAELDYLQDLQTKRTPQIQDEIMKYDQLKEAVIAPDSGPDDLQGTFMIGAFLGPKFSRATMPKTRILLNFAVRDIETICYHVKMEFKRARPNQLRPEIKSALRGGMVPPHPSYPAGHSCIGYGAATILAKLSPKNKDGFFKEADQIAVSREWAGIHYPSDSELSKDIAAQVVKLMDKVPNFKTDFQSAQSEWKDF